MAKEGTASSTIFLRVPEEVWQDEICVYLDSRSLGRLARCAVFFRDTIRATERLELRRTNSARLLCLFAAEKLCSPQDRWQFTVIRSTIRNQFVIPIPRFDICRSNFTMCFRYRVDGFSPLSRAPLIGDWENPWSFLAMHTRDGPWMELRRNIYSHGSDPKQGMIAVSADDKAGAAEGMNDPNPNVYHTAAFIWNRNHGGTLKVLYDGRCSATATPFPHVTEKDLVVQENTHRTIYIGSKSDGNENLEGEVSHFAAFGVALSDEQAQRVLKGFHAHADLKERCGDPTPPPDWVELLIE